MKRRVAPVQLGCCPEVTRCRLCPPMPPQVSRETLDALIEHTAERATADEPVYVGFYGGPPPPRSLYTQLSVPFTIRVRPDLLSRDVAMTLIEHGCTQIELDVLTFDDRVLRGLGRSYRSGLIRQMCEALSGRVELGIVLAIGLPGTGHQTCLADAAEAVAWANTARLHPVLVRDGSALREAHLDGLYRPLDLAQAVTTCAEMLDILEPAGVKVIRVGQNPHGDELAPVVAGPKHSSFRELVEARRVLSALRKHHVPLGSNVIIRCAPKDQTRVRGPLNGNVRTLRAEWGAASVRVTADQALTRGTWTVELIEE